MKLNKVERAKKSNKAEKKKVVKTKKNKLTGKWERINIFQSNKNLKLDIGDIIKLMKQMIYGSEWFKNWR